MVPKGSINDRFYRVFLSTFLSAPKCSRTNAFLTFCIVPKRHQLLLINIMLFDTFWSHFTKRCSKVSINDRFYKVLSMDISPCAFYCRTQRFLMIWRGSIGAIWIQTRGAGVILAPSGSGQDGFGPGRGIQTKGGGY